MRGTLAGLVLFAAAASGTMASAVTAPVTSETAVIATVDALHKALEQNDLPAATALVIADGRMAEVPGDVPGQALESGSWKETLWLFTRPSGDGKQGRIEKHFSPIVVVDGPSAFLRQAITAHHPGDRPRCQVEHVALIKVDGAWRIHHLTMIDQPSACYLANGY